MEAVEEVVAAPPCHNNNELSPIAKGKRTKRLRPHSPIPFTVNNHRLSPGLSAASASAEDSTTTEEEDTARCLILLARGHFPIQDQDTQHDSKQYNYNSAKRNVETAVTATGKGGTACMYTCKTCNRVFSSFQALGGHRTSHKKLKNEKKSSLFYDMDEDFPSPSKKRFPPQYSLSLQLSSSSTAGKPLRSPRIHECSYCGAEFISGQALGGHMRRHRGGPVSPLPIRAVASIAEPGPEPEPKKPRNGLSLDLNFPAPEDENQRFGFDSGQQKSPEKLVLSTTTPTLVDCHF